MFNFPASKLLNVLLNQELISPPGFTLQYKQDLPVIFDQNTGTSENESMCYAYYLCILA